MSLILAVNAGSSSLKISLFQRITHDPAVPRLLLTSSTSSISSPPSKFSFTIIGALGLDQYSAGHKETYEPCILDHESAFKYFLDRLAQLGAAQHAEQTRGDQDAKSEVKVNLDLSEIRNVCHRVVHGGEYVDPVIINEETYHHIERLSDLAPLHNGASLRVIRAAIEALPGAHSIAFFDTAFHKHIPAHVAAYAINQNIARKRGLRKYGFHGLSYAFITREVAQYLQKDPSTLNIIALHIGSGASACAIRGGKSIDTSMGLTPLSGLPGSTRAGDVDPSLIFHYTSLDAPLVDGRTIIMSRKEGVAREVHISEAEMILNTQMGWKALTGTADFGEIVRKAFPPGTEEPQDNQYTFAFNLLLDRILHYIGAYHLVLRGDVHALVFAGGVGERSSVVRRKVGEAIECLGYVGVDNVANERVDDVDGDVLEIGVHKRGKRILVCRTDEQREMARGCAVVED